ncbi:hypothetical protein I3842_06G104300 [Carya illinoinensis]|uniref:CG-1 domain-containing protein n=1 Tax=Carya illinoinensis TaxID=32201 RepID=A0A922JHI2_CARIL|nr:hypothetical protein I3842_06G104300 [Carya illinoinensis]
MTQSGYDIKDLFREAQTRWLKPAEVLFILQNHEKYQLTEESPQQPTSGSLFLFNKRVLRFFRKDGHNWRKKRDGRTVGEAHERLKVGNVEALNCYYAHGEQNPDFQRRSYWMLDPAFEHIVLVHYRQVTEGRHTSGSVVLLSPGSSSTYSQSPTSYTTQNPGSNSMPSDFFEPYQSSSSPSSEVTSEIAIKNYGMNDLDRMSRTGQRESSSELAVTQALRRLEEQLSLDEESFKDINVFGNRDESSNDSYIPKYERENSMQDQSAALLHGPEYINQCYRGHALLRKLEKQLSLDKELFKEVGPFSNREESPNDSDIPEYDRENSKQDQYYRGHDGVQDNSNNPEILHDAGYNGKHHKQSFGQDFADGSNGSLSWEEMFESFDTSSCVESQRKHLFTLDGNEKPLSLSMKAPKKEEHSHWIHSSSDNIENTSLLLLKEADNFRFPTSQDPQGKTPAYIAATRGHKGLAGYLSEVALTSHLSSLTLEESELSKGSAEVEAEMTVNNISQGNLTANGDQLSLMGTLAAVRNATQAAARIQSAFRAHSFRKRQQREAVVSIDDYGINSDDMSAMSKLAFRNSRAYNSAALSIQKKYRGWKGRQDFLAFRRKVVKIQAHVRGHQVRKHYKVICWAVGILDKVVLRWRRKGVGLRGFRNETEIIDETEDEDILKVFRKQKVDVAIDEAVSLVMSMVESPDARQQYHRVLEGYRQAKAELGDTDSGVGSTSLGNISGMEDEDMYQYP